MFKLLDVLFGCSHKRYTFPLSAKGPHRSEAAAMTGTYVVCLDCGKEFAYDWRQMKVVLPRVQEASAISETQVAKRAA